MMIDKLRLRQWMNKFSERGGVRILKPPLLVAAQPRKKAGSAHPGISIILLYLQKPRYHLAKPIPPKSVRIIKNKLRETAR